MKKLVTSLMVGMALLPFPYQCSRKRDQLHRNSDRVMRDAGPAVKAQKAGEFQKRDRRTAGREQAVAQSSGYVVEKE